MTSASAGDRLTPGISISNSGEGLASWRSAAFHLRLVCSHGLMVKSQLATAYRHIGRRIPDAFPGVCSQVSRSC